jgi:hypothetical protein
MTGAIRSSLLRAYRETHYLACGEIVRIGRRESVLRALECRSGGFVTAWNPASRRLPEGVNRRRQQSLAVCLRRFRCVPGESGLRRWREAQMLVAADPRVLAVVGRRFGQNAIVALRANQPARLILLV